MIDERLGVLAESLDQWARDAGTGGSDLPLLAVCVLRGGIFFFSDLLQRMTESVEPAFCRAWSYTKGINGSAQAEVCLDWHGTPLHCRDVVLVDNICDSGRTLAVAQAQALQAGVRSLRTVTLVHRLRADAVHKPTLSGFSYSGGEWLVGYGLRDGEMRSNLPSVYRVVPN